MKLFKSQTVEELKAQGSFREVRANVQQRLGNNLALKVRGWQDLFKVIQHLQKLADSTTEEPRLSHVEHAELDKTSLYFTSDAARIIYALVELDGEQRLKNLGVDQSHYRNLEKAKKWRNSLAMMIHPDKCNHPNAALASNKLTEMFRSMAER